MIIILICAAAATRKSDSASVISFCQISAMEENDAFAGEGNCQNYAKQAPALNISAQNVSGGGDARALVDQHFFSADADDTNEKRVLMGGSSQ